MTKGIKLDKIFKYQWIFMFISIFFLSIGYANMSIDLNIDGTVSLNSQENIAITDVIEKSSNGSLSYSDIKGYTRTNLNAYIHLDENDLDPFVTLSVTIKNLSLEKQIYDGMLYANDETEFYSNNNIIPTTNIIGNSTIIEPNSSITFDVTFKYKDLVNINENNLNGIINFHFTPLKKVSYQGISDNNLPKYIRSKSFAGNTQSYSSTITFTDDIPLLVSIRDNSNNYLINGTDFTYSNGMITFNKELTSNIIVEGLSNYTISYELNGGINPVNQVVAFIPNEKQEILNPKREDYIFLGWYDNQLFDGNVITSTEDLNGNTTLYAKWRLIKKSILNGNGETFLTNVKKLANNNTNISNAYTFPDEKITAFRRADYETYLKEKDKLTSTNLVSSNEFDTYVWFDDGIIYYYTEADVITISGSAARMFARMSNLVDISGLEYFDTKSVTDINRMFQDSFALKDLSPIANWDVSNVTDMTFTFGANTNTTGKMSIDSLSALANWDVSNVTSFYQTFKCCENLKNLDDLKSWNVKSAKNYSQMFNWCGLTDALGIKEWNITSGTDFSKMLDNNAQLPKEKRPIFTVRPGTWNTAGTYIPS